MYTRAHGWPITGAMIYQAYGPWQPAHTVVQSAIRAALADQDFLMTSGIQVRDWIYVSDVASGLERILRSSLQYGSTIDLGTGQATSLAEVVHLIYRLAGSAGKPLVGKLPDRPGEVPVQLADAERTAELLDWSPIVSLEKGLIYTIQRIHET